MEKSIFENYQNRLIAALNSINRDQVLMVAELLSKSTLQNNRIWLIGNGGSATTASHFATDLTRCVGSNNKKLKSISLCDNIGIITAIGNDFGYNNIFLRQVERNCESEDVLIAISASGNSGNLIEAINWANKSGVTTVGLTSFDGGKMRNLVNLSIHIEAGNGDYGVAEDAHLAICHMISEALRPQSI